MTHSTTLSAYLGRQFLQWLLAAATLAAVLILLFDSLELMRRAADRPDMTMGMVAEMALLRLPGQFRTVLPLCVLLGALFAFRHLTRSRELVVARASGISVWQFLAPALGLALAIGLFAVTVLGPAAAILRDWADRVEHDHLPVGAAAVSVGASGIWMADGAGGGQVLVNAAEADGNAGQLRSVTMYRLDGDGRLVERIDAEAARLTDGGWMLEAAVVTDRDGRTVRHDQDLPVPTGLTWQRIEHAGAPVETMSIWDLPGAMAAQEQAGLSSLRHRLQLHTLLASPALLCGLVLVAAAFVLHPGRRLHPVAVAAAGAATGLVLLLCSDLVTALGAAGRLPPILAAWAPAAFCIVAGTAALLRSEDG